jgi:hypothetical protein
MVILDPKVLVEADFGSPTQGVSLGIASIIGEKYRGGRG